MDKTNNEVVAVKIVRAVQRYNESAKIEASILQDLKAKGGCENNIVDLKDFFEHKSQGKTNTCLVFKPLGQSLYDFIKANKYQGFEISQLREIAHQSLKAIDFLHSIKLTHTDLKPENILLRCHKSLAEEDPSKFPIVSTSTSNCFQ